MTVNLQSQDGSYLAELLIEKGYLVHGLIRPSSSFNTSRIMHLYSDPLTHKQSSECYSSVVIDHSC